MKKGHKMRILKGDVFESYSGLTGDVQVTEILVGRGWRKQSRMVQYSILDPYNSSVHNSFWERYEDFEHLMLGTGMYILKRRGGEQ